MKKVPLSAYPRANKFGVVQYFKPKLEFSLDGSFNQAEVFWPLTSFFQKKTLIRIKIIKVGPNHIWLLIFTNPITLLALLLKKFLSVWLYLLC